MQKKHIIFVALLIAVSILLYFLPRTVVNNENKGENLSATQDTSETEHLPSNSGQPTQVADVPVISLKKLQLEEQEAALQKEARRLVLTGKVDSAVLVIDQIAAEGGLAQGGLKAAKVAFNFHSHSPRPEVTMPLNLKAIELLEQSLATEGVDSSSVMIQLALCKVAGSKPMEGIFMMSDVAKKFPENTEALYHLGAFAIQTGQWNKAIERFSALIDKDPNNAQAHFYLGVAQIEVGSQAKAKENLQKAAQLKPDPETEAAVQSSLQRLN